MRLFSKLLIGLSVAALPALCAPLALNGANDWYGFYWNQQGGAAFGAEPTMSGNVAYVSSNGNTTVLATSPSGGPDVSSWTYVGATTLTVTDLGTDGDSFQIYDNAVLLGTTSVPSNDGTGCSMTVLNDPVVCIANSKFSSGVFSLGAGTNLITIVDLTVNGQNPAGIGAFRLGAGGGGGGGGVPEPATLSLMGLGLSVGGLLRWRTKRA